MNTDLNARRWQNGLFAGAGMLLMILVIAAGIGISQRSAAEQKPATPHAALTVTTGVAKMTSWPQTLQASGAITPWQEAIIGSEISGQRLNKIRVNVGDVVKKGDVLARFNTETLKADQAQSLASWQQAESDSKRADSLKDSGAISAQQIENYHNQAASSRAQLDAKNLQLRYASVVAPDNGVISSRTATLGAIGTPGGELFRMIINGRIEWHGALDATQLVHAAPGQAVSLLLPDGTKATARIRELSPSLDANTRLAIAYADISPGSHARAGMYANGSIAIATENALIVPASAVVIRDGHPYTFILASADAQPKVTMQPVSTGRTQNESTEITAGLKDGERVVVTGAGFLSDGDTVRIVDAPGATP